MFSIFGNCLCACSTILISHSNISFLDGSISELSSSFNLCSSLKVSGLSLGSACCSDVALDSSLCTSASKDISGMSVCGGWTVAELCSIGGIGGLVDVVSSSSTFLDFFANCLLNSSISLLSCRFSYMVVDKCSWGAPAT